MRIRTGIKPGEWRDEGPATGDPAGRGMIGGELVVGGPAAPGMWLKPVPMTPEERREASRRWNARKDAA